MNRLNHTWRNFLAGLLLMIVSGIGHSANEIKAPPRTIDDILKVIQKNAIEVDSLKDAKRWIARDIPDSASDAEKNNFYFSRAEAFARVGQVDKAIKDIELVISKYPGTEYRLKLMNLMVLSSYEAQIGNLNKAIALALQERALILPNIQGLYMGNSPALVVLYSELGNFEEAEKYVRDTESTFNFLKRAPRFSEVGEFWRAQLFQTKGIYFSQQGKWTEAESSLRIALPLIEKWLKYVENLPINKLGVDPSIDDNAGSNLLRTVLPRRLDTQRLLAHVLAMQGKLIEAEIQIRDVIDLTLSYYGTNSIPSGAALLEFSSILSEQSRFAEARILAQEALSIYKNTGASDGSLAVLKTQKAIAHYLVAEKKYDEADKVFTDVSAQIEANKTLGQQIPSADLDWAIVKVKLNQSEAALRMTQELISTLKKQSNPSERQLAQFEIIEAFALHGMGRNEEAQAIYQKYIPILLSISEGDGDGRGAREHQRKILALEDEISILATFAKSKQDQESEYIDQAFKLADVVRGSSVQRALTASVARSNIKDPKLADLARKEQDAQGRIASLERILTELLSAPLEAQLPAVQEKMKKDIAQLRTDRSFLRNEIERKFPEYAELVNPKPVSVDKLRPLLSEDEVFVSWYFSDKEGFVWAVTKKEGAQFHRISMGRQQLAQVITKLRLALDPNMSTINDIPQFDIVAANALYETILAPVKEAFQGKKVMLTVPYGELGQLPLSLLVTQNTGLEIRTKNTDFSDYRQVPWLLKDIAIAQFPSATAFVSLRKAPKPNHNRRAFAGFGDPFFSDLQAKQASTQISMTASGLSRGGFRLRSSPNTRSVSSAQLGLLPRLPDTADEIENIGQVLGADPAKDIFLHQRANVANVLNTDLSDRQVLMFATHGLVPGDLNGLSQPALALTAPSVSGETEGDGLLTMDKILSMKLNADWVILSACNTALGDGAGAEAVSGLGRAFFYAGARALLATNWPVDSQSATLLTSDMFDFIKEKPRLSKPEYLQMTMRNMLDNRSLKDSKGKDLYTYAHPLFWAPYVLVGD